MASPIKEVSSLVTYPIEVTTKYVDMALGYAPTFSKMFLGVFVLGYLMALWSGWAGVPTQISGNANWNKVKDQLNLLITKGLVTVMKDTILVGAVLFGLKKHGMRPKALVGPVTVWLLSGIINLVIGLGGIGATSGTFGYVTTNYVKVFTAYDITDVLVLLPMLVGVIIYAAS